MLVDAESSEPIFRLIPFSAYFRYFSVSGMMLEYTYDRAFITIDEFGLSENNTNPSPLMIVEVYHSKEAPDLRSD
jgi:hypothetical protein